MKKVILVIMMFFLTDELFSQSKGAEEKEYNKDTVFVFESPRPLINVNDMKKNVSSAWGMDIALTDAGFGAGIFFNQFFADDLLAFANFYITGARNTDEFDEWNPYNQQYQVYNKINRLYRFPMTVGLQYFLFRETMSESLQPFVTAGLGPTFILATPYTVDKKPNGEMVGWFDSFNYAEWHTKLGSFVGVGAYIGSMLNSILAVQIKYYYIPFDDIGLESVNGMPIKDFGGIFLSLSFGTSF